MNEPIGNTKQLPKAKLLRKKLKNGLIIEKWDLVTIIEKQEEEIKQLKDELEDCICQGGHSKPYLKVKGKL